MRIVTTSLLLLLSVGTASASDGILEINQACAEQTGCFPGDTPGFPVTITSEGSYRLTGNLDILSPGLGGIRIEARATLDLGGFGIKIPDVAAIQAFAPSEVANGMVEGLNIFSSSTALVQLASNSSIRNLHVDFASESGGIAVGCGDLCLLQDLRLSTQLANGILCGSGCQLSNVTVSLLLGRAVDCGTGCVLERISAPTAGVRSGSRSQLRNSTVGHNGSNGFNRPFELGDRSIIEGCTVSVAQGANDVPEAATCGQECNISGNTFSPVGSQNSAPLLTVGTGSVVHHNIFSNSSGFAFIVTGEVGYADNVFTGNNGGNANPQLQGGTDLGGNLCGTRTTCP